MPCMAFFPYSVKDIVQVETVSYVTKNCSGRDQVRIGCISF